MKTMLELLAMLCALVAVQPAVAALNVFACEPEWAALAQEIGGDKLSVSSATTALQDPHRIEARPSLIARVRNADLLVCTGSELEVGWLPLLLTQAGNGFGQDPLRRIHLLGEAVFERWCPHEGAAPTRQASPRIDHRQRSTGSRCVLGGELQCRSAAG